MLLSQRAFGFSWVAVLLPLLAQTASADVPSCQEVLKTINTNPDLLWRIQERNKILKSLKPDSEHVAAIEAVSMAVYTARTTFADTKKNYTQRCQASEMLARAHDDCDKIVHSLSTFIRERPTSGRLSTSAGSLPGWINNAREEVNAFCTKNYVEKKWSKAEDALSWITITLDDLRDVAEDIRDCHEGFEESQQFDQEQLRILKEKQKKGQLQNENISFGSPSESHTDRTRKTVQELGSPEGSSSPDSHSAGTAAP